MTQSALPSGSSARLAVRAAIAPVVMLGLLFLAAGRWDYWEAWVYSGLNLGILVFMAVMSIRNPGLAEERLRPGEGMKGWDKVYFALSTPMYLVCLVLAGLDARFGWTGGLPALVYAAGVLVYLAGQAVFLWARFTNQYFSSVVRIQTDRGQTVCKDGPYRFVRHPGYVGGILFAATMGLVLGSWWATVPQLLAALLLVWRTAREDQTLQAELPGYTEYTAETRYRLVPGVW
jgi:protein-S-isoprenylcysteine O-methyltransferase Ste14